MKRFLALITLIVSASLQTASAQQAPVDIAQQYLDFMSRTSAQSELIWPGFRLEDKVHIFSMENTAWLQKPYGQITQDDSTLSSFNNQTASALSVEFTEYQGAPAILLELNETDTVLESDAISDVGLLTWAGTSIYEAFHFYEQSEWAILEQQVQLAGEVYPLSINARFAREQLFQQLLLALTNTEQRSYHLGLSSFWLQRWRTIAPLEDQVGFANDLIEGSAAYVALMSGIKLAQSTASIDDKLTVQHQFVQRYYQQAHRLGWDAEAQGIGALAGLLLDAIQGPVRWKEAAEDGVLPLDMLLGQVASITPVMREEADTMLKIKQQFAYYPETNKVLTKLLSDVDDTRLPLLVLPSINDAAVFLDTDKIRSGFYIAPYQDGVVQAYIGVNTQLDNLNFTNANVIDIGAQSLCDGLENATLVPVTGLYHVEAGYLVMEQGDVQGMIRVIPTQVDDRTLFCAVL